MLDTAETGVEIAKRDHEAQLPELRVALVNAQYDLRESERALLVVLAGDDRPGAAAVFNRLHEWMDARYLHSHAWGAPGPGDELQPQLWRYWHGLPPRGSVGLWLGGFPQALLRRGVEGELDADGLERALLRFRRFEDQLASEGVALLKLWVHLSAKEHRKRARRARKRNAKHADVDGVGEWRLDEVDWRICDDYDAMEPLAERILAGSGDAVRPWVLVEGQDARTRDTTAARAILAAAERAVAGPPPAAPPASLEPVPGPSVLESLDLSAELDYDDYKKRLGKLQKRLFERVGRAGREGLRTVLVFEGWDAAGKGGVIRRITGALDARDYRVHSIAAPSEAERQHPYLWRFWQRLPAAGKLAIFDRSWYGRVLVERVEGFASESDWRRAYGEINDFEEQLAFDHTLLLKFWLHIDPDEQIARFRAREKAPYKKYKITEEDYRNREKRDAYEAALHEMVWRTNRPHAPWHLVAANDKRWARVAVIDAVCRSLGRALGKGG